MKAENELIAETTSNWTPHSAVVLERRYPGLHDWISRRFTVFITAANSLMALILGLIAAVLIAILDAFDHHNWSPFLEWICSPFFWPWIATIFGLSAIFARCATQQREEHYEMMEFLESTSLLSEGQKGT